MSYVALIEALQQAEVILSCILPGTGDALAKVAADKRNYTYHINGWWTLGQIPPLMLFLWQEVGESLMDMVTTFNMGTGMYLMARPDQVARILDVGRIAGYEMMDIGYLDAGPRQTVVAPGLFGDSPELTLPAPGD
jgi:phosphoribosylaminoimidazole (AIR) synthetase